MDRLSALTMPVVTLFERPSGAPTAMVASPTFEIGRRGEVDRREVLGILELDDGKVVRRVETDDLGVVHASVGGRDAKRRAGGRTVEGHDVRVRHHIAVLREDHAGSGAAARVAGGGDRDHGGHDLRRDRVRLADRVGVVDDDRLGPCGRPIHRVAEQVDARDRTAEAAAPPTIAAATISPTTFPAPDFFFGADEGAGPPEGADPEGGWPPPSGSVG